ncbi:MAG: flavin oxidoreductase [Cyanothece sp. SIO1E1]|nr:flavin oxidoreductase [Cyanothece sp. SIO1E1]
MSETKPRDVQIFPLAAHTYGFRSRSWSRLRFEIEYGLERGTTANSFLIKADKTVLIDPPGASFTEIYLEALQKPTANAEQKLPFWSNVWAQLRWVTQQKIDFDQLGFELSRLDYVILGHVNPNRVETLKALLALAPHVTFICSNPGAIALRAALPDHNLQITVIRGTAEETLDLGKGHQLKFIPAPIPRWPDGLLTYDTYTQILFTDKFFGAHICGEQIFDASWEALRTDRRYYYDCLMAPHARQVETVVAKLESLSAKIYAPGHGPIVLSGLTELTHAYHQWSQQQKSQTTMVALLYASAYGNTATVAQAIARGITKAGVSVESINCEAVEPNEIQSIVEKASGFIIGSPTLGGHAPTQIQTALGVVLSTVSKDKLAGVFGSYGWSGEAIDLLENKLKDAGYSFGFEPIRVKFKPTDVTLKYCEEAGTDFAQALKKAKKARTAREGKGQLGSQVTPTEQAIGRLVGSLCIVTAQHGDVASAMLASWVAQATFNPPGFTVAVAKERAIESLLYPDSPFVLNILGESQHLGLMKHFLKPFGPGEDRFAGVNLEISELGVPILQDAIAYLECQVANRMECGDHWVVYAKVASGQVLQANAKTAVHHRKSGSHY